MGIQGLLPLLKPIQKPVSIAEHFAGQVIGIDAYCWLHKGAYGCAMELVEGKKSSVYVCTLNDEHRTPGISTQLHYA